MLDYAKRDLKINKMSQKGYTLKKIGEEFGISGERVRIILLRKSRKLCLRHKILYLKQCSHCAEEKNYAATLKKISKEQLIVEIDKLKKRGRGWKLVMQRRFLVGRLAKEGFSQRRIGKLLGRDHSTILKSYGLSSAIKKR
jgi:DNA-directed RNA polymerase specialized sigma subunit